MKKTFIFLGVFAFLFSTSYLLIPKLVSAQDAPNTNITKRRPDRPADYSPTPVPTTQPVDIKQVESQNPSFLGRLWLSLQSFFANFFASPTASSTVASPTPTQNASTVVIASADPTSSWKTYTDQYYDFTIKIPPTYSAQYHGNGFTLTISDDNNLTQLKIDIQDTNVEPLNQYTLSTQESLQASNNASLLEPVKQTLFQTYFGYSFSLSQACNNCKNTTYDMIDDTHAQIDYLTTRINNKNILFTKEASKNNTVDQILQTFRFTN